MILMEPNEPDPFVAPLIQEVALSIQEVTNFVLLVIEIIKKEISAKFGNSLRKKVDVLSRCTSVPYICPQNF